MINSVKKFLELGLPIKRYTNSDGISSTDLSGLKVDDHNIAFEIDLSNIKRIERALGIAKMDCFPILWCY
jgi:hypothetical protein